MVATRPRSGQRSVAGGCHPVKQWSSVVAPIGRGNAKSHAVDTRSSVVGITSASVCHTLTAAKEKTVAAMGGKDGCPPRPEGDGGSPTLSMATVVGTALA